MSGCFKYEDLDKSANSILKTSEIIRQVVEGESFTIEKRGVPVAGIRPISVRPSPRMPDREALITSGPEPMDSGLILEQDRT